MLQRSCSSPAQAPPGTAEAYPVTGNLCTWPVAWSNSPMGSHTPIATGLGAGSPLQHVWGKCVDQSPGGGVISTQATLLNNWPCTPPSATPQLPRHGPAGAMLLGCPVYGGSNSCNSPSIHFDC